MKRMIALLTMATVSVSLVACGSKEETENVQKTADIVIPEETEEDTDTVSDTSEEAVNDTLEATEVTGTSIEKGNTLVVYFSATGNTRKIAESIAQGLSADIYEIVPAELYTDEDLNYNDDNSRTTLEMNDLSARPEIAGTVENFDQYDMVFLGYPIWWGEAPKILDTFVESYDFTDKTVIPFCTSGGSGIGSSADTLEELAGSGTWMEGQRFQGNETADQVLEWAEQF